MSQDKKERRKEPRVETELKADFRDHCDFSNSFLGNISRGGILVKTEKPLDIDSEFKLKFSIKGIEKTFETTCKVMWIQELYDKFSDKLIPAMGCKFVELSPEDLKLIEDFISDKEAATN